MGWGDNQKIRDLEQQVRQLETRVNDLERGGALGEQERKQLLGETNEVKHELRDVTGHVSQISEKVAHIAGRLEGRGPVVNVSQSQDRTEQNIHDGSVGQIGENTNNEQ